MKMPVQWWVIGAMAAGFGVLLIAQQLQLERLNGELAGLRVQQQVAKRSNVETRRVEAAPAVLTRTSNGADELRQLRTEVAALEATFREMELPSRKNWELAAIRNLAASDWTNAGRATPEAALETALWAAAAGELDELAQTLVLDEQARETAGQLFESLPQEARAEYPNPERLIALLAAKDVPASTMMAHVSELPNKAAGEARLRVKLHDASGATRTARLTLRAAAGGWNVVVSDRDVARFAANLKRE